MNAFEKREELSEHITNCGLRVVKRTKKYVVHEGWDDKHRIYIPLRGPVWVGPTLKEADTKYSTHTIKMYAEAYARGPIKSGKRNMVTGKFAKPTVIDLVHPKPLPPKKRVRKPKVKVNRETVMKKLYPNPHPNSRKASKPVVKKNPELKHVGSFPSRSDFKIIYDVNLHKKHGIMCNCPGFATAKDGKFCSHIQRIFQQHPDVRMAHERVKAGMEAF